MGGSHPYRRFCIGAWTLAACVLAGGSLDPALARTAAGVAGKVTAQAQPVDDATVYAYQVVEKSLRRVLTDGGGEFLFVDLPAGLYKIIVHKTGFSPAVAVLTRRAVDQSQYVQVELPATARTAPSDDYWQLRAEIPADVLRELDAPLGPEVIALASEDPIDDPAVLTQVAALTAVSDFGAGSAAQLTGGQVGLRGQVGDVRLSVDGDFRSVASAADSTLASVEGESAALRFKLEGPASGQFDVASESQRLVTFAEYGEIPVSYERFQVRYHRDLGEDGSTAVLAQYVDETGLYGGSRIVHPLDLPVASRALRVEGTYAGELGESSRLRSGVRYLEGIRDYSTRRGPELDDGIPVRSIDAWTFADWQINPTYVLQYGIYSTAQDGTVSIAPRGGLLVRFGPQWQASVSTSRRIELDPGDPLRSEFRPATLGASFTCADAEASCHELQVLHGDDRADHFAVGGSWREFDRTVRLFLEDDLFAASEGLFLVPGDELPEVHASVRRQLGRNFVTRWSSSFAEGGGGSFRAANLKLYENQVKLLSTGVETTFQPTSTGLYVALHRVEQRLEPLARRGGGRQRVPEAELERLELTVSQDLSPFVDLTTDWAIRLGLELARGGTLFQSLSFEPGEIRHRVTTAVAVRF